MFFLMVLKTRSQGILLLIFNKDLQVQLQNGDSGVVEVHYRKEWGTLCDDEFDFQDAHVLCQMAGFR